MTILIILIVVWFICLLGLLYSFRQFPRINTVRNIRRNWIETNDSRYDIYTFEEMLKANKQNWYGLKIPKDKDFR